MTGSARAKRIFLALLVAGIWITLFCTAPNQLGTWLWGRFGFRTDLPLGQLTRVSLISMAVLALILFAKRAPILVPRRPARPALILLFVPLMAINFARGPLVEAGVSFFVSTLAVTLLTGFWEEFLFRGMIQDRLAVMGWPAALLSTSVMFGLIHAHKGFHAVWIAIAIGLAFSVARARIGLWPLVLIHATIDFSKEIFERQWAHYGLVGQVLVGVYGLVALVVLVLGKRD